MSEISAGTERRKRQVSKVKEWRVSSNTQIFIWEKKRIGREKGENWNVCPSFAKTEGKKRKEFHVPLVQREFTGTFLQEPRKEKKKIKSRNFAKVPWKRGFFSRVYKNYSNAKKIESRKVPRNFKKRNNLFVKFIEKELRGNGGKF